MRHHNSDIFMLLTITNCKVQPEPEKKIFSCNIFDQFKDSFLLCLSHYHNTHTPIFSMKNMCCKILCFLAVLTLTAAGETCHPNDLKGLRSFQAAIQSDPSARLVTWTGGGCCRWEGITCDNTTGRVTEINLPGFFTSDDAPVQTSMTGSISPSITLLKSLEVLDLSGLIGLTGEIPPMIGLHLPRLRKLALSGNKIEGPLPETVGKLSKLQELYLSENSLTGSISGNLGNLKALRMLDLDSNRLSGVIPESITSLSILERLGLQNNFLTGSIPSDIGDLQCLKELDLSNNSLSGRIPPSLTKLKAASIIYLDNNQLVGEIPRLLSPDQMPSLSFLKLNDNKLTGRIPYSFGFLPSLQRASLANNKLNGSIPSSLGGLRSLTELYLNGNGLSGRLPSTISQLSNLLILRVSNNLIEGPLPHQMAALTNLQTLDLSFNRLNFSYIPEWLLKMPSLSRIFLARCRIEGGISEDLLVSPSPLQELDLSANHLTGNIPEWIGKLPELYSLNLSVNNLIDKIPSSIINLANLGVLDLHSNKLAGSLQWVFQIQSRFTGGSLTFLDLSDNSFTGGIEQIGTGLQLEMQYINLSHNLIKGKLPASIGRLESMKSLDLSCNSVDSELPPALANVSSLTTLKLQKNHFTGKIPDGFLEFKNLKELDLSDNSLEGKIPYGKPLIDFPRESYSGNKGLCGIPLEPCQS